MVLGYPPLCGSERYTCIFSHNPKRQTVLQVRAKQLKSLQSLIPQ
jgi:hypothetical protein